MVDTSPEKEAGQTHQQSAHPEYKGHSPHALQGTCFEPAYEGIECAARIREHRMTTKMAASWPGSESATPMRIRATILQHSGPRLRTAAF
jgi:hypothetical protein